MAATRQAAPDNASALMDRALCLSIIFSKLWTTRSVDSAQITKKDEGGAVETEVERKYLRASKVLFEAPELQAIVKYDEDTVRLLNEKKLPSKIIRSGVYLIPNDEVAPLDSTLEERKTIRAGLVDALVQVYPTRVRAAKPALGPLWDPTDYPTSKQLRAKFEMRWNWISFSAPKALAIISKSLYKKEAEKVQIEVAQAAEEVKQQFASGLLAAIRHMAEKLSEGKRFQKGSVEKINTLFEMLTKKLPAVGGFPEIEAIVEQGRKLLDGVDPASLRKDEDLRLRVAQGFGQMQAQLDTLVVDKPTRAVTFEEEA